MFEKASRMKLRFETAKGMLTVEDLWDIPLLSANGLSLDNIAIKLDRQLKDTMNVSFVKKEQTSNSIDQLRFDIVRHIIAVRQDEQEKAKSAAELREREQRLLQLLDRKRTEADEKMSEDEIKGHILGVKGKRKDAQEKIEQYNDEIARMEKLLNERRSKSSS
jgi:hypothetical protein